MDSTETFEDGIPLASVSTRASGRPPEEATSDDPEEQAHVILKESQDRTSTAARDSAQSDN
jgi:hypothetical protein